MSARWIFIVLCQVCVLSSHGAQYLMRTSPGGDNMKPAGVWAGKLRTEDKGQAEDLFTHGFSELDGVDSSVSGLQVTDLSRDPEGRGLLMVSKDAQGYTSLAVGSGLCGSNKPEVLLYHVKLVDADNPYMSDAACGHKCGWGPVALYGGRVYFVLTGVFGRIYSSLERRMQIRLLETSGECEDVINELGPREDATAMDFNVLQCSTLVATLFTEEYEKPTPRPSLWSTQHLAVGSVGDTLHFYLQLIDTSSADTTEIRLVHVASGETSMRTLTSSPLDDVFAGSLSVSGLGSVDYRAGTLCWTAGDTLRCSVHEPGGSVEPVIVLPAGEARSNGICTGIIPDEELQRAVTGVSIAESSKSRLAVYFGCYAERPGVGGVGLVTLTQNGLVKGLYSVTSGGRKIYGSHVIVMNRLRSNCAYEDDTTVPDDVTTTPSACPSKEPCACSTSIGSANGGVTPTQNVLTPLLLSLLIIALSPLFH